MCKVTILQHNEFKYGIAKSAGLSGFTVCEEKVRFADFFYLLFTAFQYVIDDFLFIYYNTVTLHH